MVFLIHEALLPARHLHEQLSHLREVTYQAEVAGNPTRMCRIEIVSGKPLGSEICAQLAINNVQISECPEVILLQAILVDIAQRGLDIAELVGVIRREIYSEAFRHQRTIVHVADVFYTHVVRQIGRGTAVREQEPVDIWVAPAGLEKQRHPKGPTSKIWDYKADTRVSSHAP